MRELKFRAWDGKKMHDVISFTGMMVKVPIKKFPGQEQIFVEEIMQYTGLLDKNGKEIYEGDLIKISGGLKLGFYPDNGEVIYNNHSASFVMKALNDCNVYMNFGLGFSDGTEIEIIGNIHEA